MALVGVDDSVESLLARYSLNHVLLGRVLCDDHDGVALDYVGPDGESTLSFAELKLQSMQFAGALRAAGVDAGSVVAVMLPKSPELLVALVAIWRLGAVHVPLFTAFGPEAVAYRVRHSGAQTVVTSTAHRPKFAEAGDSLRVFCVATDDAIDPRDLHFRHELERAEAVEGGARGGDDLMVLLYTSGTTGQPKGVEFPVRALASVHAYMHYGLDLRPDDVFWNIADPGWGYGLWFAVIGPLLLGHTTIMRATPFSAADALSVMTDRGVTNLTGAPTVFRAIRSDGVPAEFRERSRLRAVSSAGEPLNPELLQWSTSNLGVAIHDHYGQSELGMPIGFAHHPMLHRGPTPGSMGCSAPGFRAVVLDEAGNEAGPGTDGELAIDIDGSPLYWFRSYFKDPERTAERFVLGQRYHLTGDRAQMDTTGVFRFASRADDVITSSGYRIGPFEVESALMAHPAVSEVAVIGTPDELRGEAVTAFVVLCSGIDRDPELSDELQQFVKGRLAAHLYPRRVLFVDELPRTPSGKVQRMVLRQRWDAERPEGAA